ncbi:hypothetical protein MKEN_00871800 [Mycena kentingensis (nom. inval.)]|nr:hypothetical protein MKEN_00871800 [Mycena kentingensis (nom. inval.)]
MLHVPPNAGSQARTSEEQVTVTRWFATLDGDFADAIQPKDAYNDATAYEASTHSRRRSIGLSEVNSEAVYDGLEEFSVIDNRDPAGHPVEILYAEGEATRRDTAACIAALELLDKEPKDLFDVQVACHSEDEMVDEELDAELALALEEVWGSEE